MQDFFLSRFCLFLIRVRGLGFCGEGGRVISDGQARRSQEDKSGGLCAGAEARSQSLPIWHSSWQAGGCQWVPGSLGCSPGYGPSEGPGQGLEPVSPGQDLCHFSSPCPGHIGQKRRQAEQPRSLRFSIMEMRSFCFLYGADLDFQHPG